VLYHRREISLCSFYYFIILFLLVLILKQSCVLPGWLFALFTWVSLFFFKQVQLAIRVRSFQYNTTKAYYKCTFTDGKCSLNIMFPNGNVAVLNSFGPEQVNLFIFTVTSLF
jgi:hypothetical protein